MDNLHFQPLHNLLNSFFELVEYGDAAGPTPSRQRFFSKAIAFDGNAADIFGGGVSCADSSPVLIGCTITKNTAAKGGGIYCGRRSAPTVTPEPRRAVHRFPPEESERDQPCLRQRGRHCHRAAAVPRCAAGERGPRLAEQDLAGLRRPYGPIFLHAIGRRCLSFVHGGGVRGNPNAYAHATFPDGKDRQQDIYANPWNQGYDEVEQAPRDGHFWSLSKKTGNARLHVMISSSTILVPFTIPARV